MGAISPVWCVFVALVVFTVHISAFDNRESRRYRDVWANSSTTQHVQDSSVDNPESRIYHEILANHSTTQVRPVAQPGDILEVEVGFSLNNIVGFDVDNYILTVRGWITMAWQDAFIQWDHTDDGVEGIRVRPWELWTPDIRGYNTISEFADNVEMLVRPDGQVMYFPPTTIRVQCSDGGERNYQCSVKLGSWTYNGFQLSLRSYGDPSGLDISNYQPHPRWNLTSVEGARNEVFYDCCPEPYHDWKMDITITDLR